MDNGTSAILGALVGGGIAFGITAYFKAVDQAREKYILASGILVEIDDHHETITRLIDQFRENLSDKNKPNSKKIYLSSVQDIHSPPREPQFIKANLSNIGILSAPVMIIIIDYMDKVDVVRHVINHVINEKNSVLPFSNNAPKLYTLSELSQVLDYIVNLREDCELIQRILLKNKRYHRILGMVWDLDQ